MLHATWRRILSSTSRLVLTVLAVATGVTFLTGSLVLADSTRAALDDSYAQVYAGVDVVVRGPESIGEPTFAGGAAPLPESAVERVRQVPGVAAAEGRLSSVAQLAVPGGEGVGEAALATAVPADPDRAALEVRSGRLPTAPAEVAVDAAVASTSDLDVADEVQVLLPDGTVDAEVVGIVGFGRLDALAGGARVLFDAEVAAGLLGDAYSEVLVHAEDGIAPADLAERLAGALDDAQVLTAAQVAARDAATAARQTAVISQVVMGVAAIALLIGAFLIANTFRMLVGQRTRELALLRAIGADRRQVARSVLLEAGITGVLGSVLGVALGVGAGALLVSGSAGLMPGLPPVSATVAPRALLAGPIVGTVVALLAGRGAARRALAVPPVAAMRMVSTPDDGVSRRRIGAGAVIGVVGVGAVVVGLRIGTSLPLLGGAAAVIVGVGLLFPLLTGPALALLSRPLRAAGIPAALARQQALAAPRRVGTTAAALAVTLALVTFLLVVNASLGASTPQLLASRQHADFVVRSTARSGLHDSLLGVAERMDGLAEVATAEVVTYGEARISDPAGDDPRPLTASLYVVDPSGIDDLFDVRSRAGDVGTVGPGELAVRESAATARGLELGEQVSAELPDGTTVPLVISASFDGAVTTDWIVAPETVDAHLPAAYREAFVRLVDGVSVEEARPALDRIVADERSAVLLSRDEQAAETSDANESSLGILTALFSLSLVIGVLGVVNTLTLSVVERVRELGVLRAIGATRGQVRSMIRWEALLTSILGALLGAALGLPLAWLATQALQDAALSFTIPGIHVGIAVLATALLGTAASVAPAVRASRLDVLRALQTT